MKYFLIPQEIVQSWRDIMAQQRADTPSETNQHQLRSEMEELSDKDYQSFSQKLGEYLTARRKHEHPPSQPLDKQQMIDKILQSIPAAMKEDGGLLLHNLASRSDFAVDAQDRAIVDGQVIQSNIVDVIRYLVGKSKTPPEGSSEMINLLERHRVPESLIRNPFAKVRIASFHKIVKRVDIYNQALTRPL